MSADLLQATQDAVFQVLSAAARSQAATVRQHVRERDPAVPFEPLVIIGDMDAEPQGGKDGFPDAIVIDVHSIYRGESRRPLLAMMADNRAALDGAALSAPGVDFGPCRWIASNTSLGTDGVTYAGQQQFRIFAEPATASEEI